MCSIDGPCQEPPVSEKREPLFSKEDMSSTPSISSLIDEELNSQKSQEKISQIKVDPIPNESDIQKLQTS